MDDELMFDEFFEDVPGEESFSESPGLSEYEQMVVDRLDSIQSVLAHQYSLGLFTVGCFAAIFVCVLLYRFLLRAFY